MLEPEDISVECWSERLEREVGARVMSLEPSQDFECRRGERLRRAYEISRDRESTVREIESRRFEISRVRAFELDSSVIPTVKSETNKESGN
jgi:hypothetical protein